MLQGLNQDQFLTWCNIVVKTKPVNNRFLLHAELYFRSWEDLRKIYRAPRSKTLLIYMMI